MSIVLPLLFAAVFLSVAMAAAWLVARKPGQSGWTDVFWTFATGAAGVLVAVGFPLAGSRQPPGLPARQGLVAALAAIWALRLGLHIAARTRHHGEDPRYAALREEWGPRFPQRMFLFLQIQAAAALLLVISIALAAHNPAPRLGWGDALGVAILVVAIVGEGVADRQLRHFRANPANRGRVCDQGLWSLSRHPNYFFEWLGWTAYAVIALAPDAQPATAWLALIGPIFMYVLLVHVSGVPPLEEHMLKSRGPEFRAYQARVSAFWPIPK
jgi:steroid 5-alpha reductase family enzyme